MWKRMILAVVIVYGLLANAQEVRTTPRKKPGKERPVCSPGAICFSGRVTQGEEFRRSLNTDMDFVLERGSSRGWSIGIVPKHPEGECKEFASVVNGPYRAHRDLYIDTSYGWSADDEVATSPREFRFVTNCGDERTEWERLNIVLYPYNATEEREKEALASLGTLARGKGRLWITDSRVSHSMTDDDKLGRIEWISFSVEVILSK